ncbi:MAG TPA: c-type cytochrome [Terriglobales bacterium]|nr:c-type cytochrome [Terriglobales bacterium]
MNRLGKCGLRAFYAVPALIGLALVSFCAGGCGLSNAQVREAASITGGGDARAGRTDILKYGCYTCHTIAGVPGAQGLVGPSLNDIGQREFIAGEFPNTPADLMRWIQNPQQIKPNTLMPDMHVTQQDSQDIAAYLYTLH